ncbi:MAG TPA: hypothetical protein VGE76_22645 [Opitutaceae bacterium]
MNTLRWVAVSLVLAAQAWALEMERIQVKDNPRTLGVDFSLLRPKAWAERARVGPSPSVIVAFWSTPQGVGDNMTLVVPGNQNAKRRAVSKAEYKKAFEHPQMERAISAAMPFAEVHFVRKQLLENYKYPAGYLDYDAKATLPGGGLQSVRVRTYIVYLGSVMLQVQFYLPQAGGEDRLKTFEPEMTKIVESLEWRK